MNKKQYLTVFALAASVSLPTLARAEGANDQSPQASSGIAEIVVTAQKRSESLQKVSASVQVLGQKEISRISEARDLSTITPGVQVGVGGAAAQIYVRGVGDNSNNAASNPGVAVNFDGVPTKGIPFVSEWRKLEDIFASTGCLPFIEINNDC